MMINFRDLCICFWDNFDEYVDEKYIIDDGKEHFINNKKTNLEDIIAYPFYNHGRTTAIEAIDFIRERTGDKNMTLSKSSISKRRRLIEHVCYVDMNEDFVNEIYNNDERPGLVKGYSLLACDSSICDAPNIGYTEEKLKKLNNPHLNRLRNELIRFRASCIVDTQTDFILTATLTNSKKMGEVELAIEHLDNLNQRIDMSTTVTAYDRAYGSFELMLKHVTINSKFVIRLKSDDLINERQHMLTNDEYVTVNLNSGKTQNFHNKELKEKALENRSMNIRITEIELTDKKGKKYTEILASNLPLDEFTTQDLKEIYNKRWKVETNFDRLKNIIHIENYSGYSEQIILQDFYANVFIFNYLMAMKLDADQKVQQKHKNKKLKHEYKTNLNVLFGLIKLDMPDLLSNSPYEKTKAVDRILNTAQSNLIEKNKKHDRNPDRKVKDPTNKYPPTQRRAEWRKKNKHFFSKKSQVNRVEFSKSII